MSIKSILFFSVIFGFIIFGYFYHERFLQIFPIHIIIKLFIVIIGVFSIYFPQIIKKLRNGDDIDEIKTFIIKKYKKK